MGRPFDELTRLGQVRRLGALARKVATEHYLLAEPRVRLVSRHSFNTVFRIDASGCSYALRVGSQVRIHETGVEDIEAEWLDALSVAGFENAVTIAAADARRWVTATIPTVPGTRVCTLFSWVPGVELRRRTHADYQHQAGQLLARLHRHAQHFESEQPLDSVAAKQAIYFGETDMVSGYESEHGSLFVEATNRVQQMLDQLWASETNAPHLLHGDFGAHNLLQSRDTLRPIDFQDLRFGYAIHDLGVTLADLHRQGSSAASDLLRGYRSITALADMDPELLATLRAQRSLNIMNLALLSPRSGIGQVLGNHAERVVDWMSNAS